LGLFDVNGVTGGFDQGLWALLREPVARHQLREALIARYFPEHREELAPLVVGNRASQEPNNLEEQLPPGRAAAFRLLCPPYRKHELQHCVSG